jgi:hypothetical protein
MGRFPWQVVLINVILGLLGCDSGSPKTYTITGTVTFDGHRVEDGEIIFVPVEKEQAPDAGHIKNGTYTVEVKAGHKRVEVRAIREVPDKRTPMGPVHEQYLPECYNSKSRLTAEITADGTKRWDFNLERVAK